MSRSNIVIVVKLVIVFVILDLILQGDGLLNRRRPCSSNRRHPPRRHARSNTEAPPTTTAAATQSFLWLFRKLNETDLVNKCLDFCRDYEKDVSSDLTEEVNFLREISPDAAAIELINMLKNRSDSRVRPGIYGNSTIVKIDFYVQSLGPLNEMDMEFSADIDFRETWNDPRLKFNSSTDNPIYIPHQNTKEFWIPDIYFPNEKTGSSHDITVPNQSIRIYPNGTVRYFTRVGMKLSCTMNLENFPLDYQDCAIKISTYSYDAKEIQLEWFDDEPIEVHTDDLQLPQFNLINYSMDHCIENYKTGNFSCLAAIFHLKRRVGYYVLQTYVPSMLIVILSWVAFWINKDSEPARIALGVTTVLTMTTQLTTSRSNSMRVSYPKAIDVWYATCMMFVFAALVEYAFVNSCSRQEKKMKGLEKKTDVEMQMLESNETNGVKTLSEKEWFYSRFPMRWRYSSKNIDWMSRRIFPLLFLIFNMVYWPVYSAESRRKPSP